MAEVVAPPGPARVEDPAPSPPEKPRALGTIDDEKGSAFVILTRGIRPPQMPAIEGEKLVFGKPHALNHASARRKAPVALTPHTGEPACSARHALARSDILGGDAWKRCRLPHARERRNDGLALAELAFEDIPRAAVRFTYFAKTLELKLALTPTLTRLGSAVRLSLDGPKPSWSCVPRR